MPLFLRYSSLIRGVLILELLHLGDRVQEHASSRKLFVLYVESSLYCVRAGMGCFVQQMDLRDLRFVLKEESEITTKLGFLDLHLKRAMNEVRKRSSVADEMFHDRLIALANEVV